MHGILGFIKLDCVIFGVGKGWWDGFPHSHGYFLAHAPGNECTWPVVYYLEATTLDLKKQKQKKKKERKKKKKKK